MKYKYKYRKSQEDVCIRIYMFVYKYMKEKVIQAKSLHIFTLGATTLHLEYRNFTVMLLQVSIYAFHSIVPYFDK